MTDVIETKRILKRWEASFYKENGRKPSKDDIDKAPDEIKETYSKYTKLRKGQSTQSSSIKEDYHENENRGDNFGNKIGDNFKNDYTGDNNENNKGDNLMNNEKEDSYMNVKGDNFVEENKEDNFEKDSEGNENDNKNHIDVWGSQFNRKLVKDDKTAQDAKKSTNMPSFLKNLGDKMYKQSLRLNKLQTTVPACKPTWKKPDTPRPTKHLSIFSPDATKSDNCKESSMETNDNDEMGTSKNDENPLIKGKMFEKAQLISKHIRPTEDIPEDSDVYMNRYSIKSKSKPCFLPSSYSGLLEKHRKNLVIEEVDDDYETSANNIEEKNEDIEEMDSGKDGGGHSWNMSVSKLIQNDELEVKREKARNLKAINAEKKAASKIKASAVDTKDKKKQSVKTKGLKVEDAENVTDPKPSVQNQNNVNRSDDNAMSGTDHGSVGEFSSESKSDTVKDDNSLNEPKVRKRAPRKSIVKKERKVTQKLDYSDDEINENSKNELNSNSEEDDSFNVPKVRKRVARKPNVKKEKKVTLKLDYSDGENIEEPANDSGSDIESSNKKRKKTNKSQPAAKKRKTASANMVDDDGKPTSVPVKAAPRAKASSDGNFIRLNMKIKTYKRKGRHMTGPQHKRMMWKQKMQARSASYGNACFKCGQPGHWANKCPGKGGQSASTYDKEPVNDEDFPSMKEAAMMAKGVKYKKPEAMKKVTESSVDTTLEGEPPEMIVDDDIDEDLELQSTIVRSRSEVNEAPPSMEPLISCDGDNVPATPKFVMEGLKKFGFDSFRTGQEEAVMRILCGLSTLVVLSTGGGKSLCYQLPAYLYSQRSTCITLVVSPLVSLMEDQVTGLPRGIRGVCLHTNMTASQRESVLETVKSGNAQFLLVSPEAIAGGSMSLISTMSSLPPVAFVCIDEAHCLSEWSHNFRPSYLRLCKVLKEKLGINCFLGLTATATLSTACDVARHLNISDFKKATVRGSPIPANLILSVSRDENREEALIGLLKGDRFGKLDSIIIYCTRRDQTEKVATVIRTCMNVDVPPERLKGKSGRGKLCLAWDAESYHAGLTPAQRKRVQNAFMSGILRVVVATVAFGMGLDKSDVRGVIHFNMPKSFESYVQEIGRAGRDGERADCHVFLDPEGKDLCELRRHTYANTVDYRTLKKLVQKVFQPCRCREVHEKQVEAAKEIDFGEEFEMELEESSEDIGSNINTSTKTLKEENDQQTVSSLGLDKKDFNEQSKLSSVNIDGEDKDFASSPTENTKSVICSEGQINVHITDNNSSQTSQGNDQTVPEKTDIFSHKRLCPGHERALPIQQTVLDLDMKEEGISTLLCYLELHSNEWLENMSNVYANCKIQCYGGPAQLQSLAKKCPPVAVAIAKSKKEGKKFTNCNEIEFSVVDISDTMGWNSGSVKKELKLLMWNFDSGAPKRTGVMIEFTDLAYHFRSPGDFTVDELDDILQFLHERIQRQEKSEIKNLSLLSKALRSVSHKNYFMCSEEADMVKNDKLKVVLNEYFDKKDLDGSLESVDDDFTNEPIPDFSKGQLLGDIRAFYNLYGQEHSLTGRAVARIFHGIASPCFPATTWGRVRRFWRSHLNVDFNTIMKLATKELVLLK